MRKTSQSLALKTKKEVVEEFGGRVQFLAEDIERHSKTEPLLLEVLTDHNAKIQKIHKRFEKSHPENILLVTPYQGVFRELRRRAPRWLYGSTPAQLVKINLFTSLYLESLATMRFDVFLLQLNDHGQPLVSQRLLKELLKRHKKILVRAESSQIEKFMKTQSLFIAVQSSFRLLERMRIENEKLGFCLYFLKKRISRFTL